MITIVLADDHNIVRQGLRFVLEAEPGFTVVGEAADGLAAVDLVKRLQPTVLVVDLMMPGLNGLDVTREVSRRFPDTHIVVLSMHASEAYVLEALESGATAYVLKEDQSTDLVQAVHEVIAGRRYFSSPLSEHALELYQQKARDATLDRYETLTTREREVLHLVAEGHTNAEVAGRLSIGQRTAEFHRANLMRKLCLRNQTELIRYAIRRGIIPLED